MVAEHIERDVFFAMFPLGTLIRWWDDQDLHPGKVIGREETEDKTTIFFRLDTDDGRARRRCEWHHRSRIVLDPSVPQGLSAPTTIIRIVASNFGLDPSLLTGRGRDDLSVRPRWIAMYLIRQETDLTLAETGAVLGGRCPATISYGYGKIATGIELNGNLRREVRVIRGILSK